MSKLSQQDRITELEAEVAELNEWVGHLHDEVIAPQQRAAQDAVRALLSPAMEGDLRFSRWVSNAADRWWSDQDIAGRAEQESGRIDWDGAIALESAADRLGKAVKELTPSELATARAGGQQEGS